MNEESVYLKPVTRDELRGAIDALAKIGRELGNDVEPDGIFERDDDGLFIFDCFSCGQPFGAEVVRKKNGFPIPDRPCPNC